MKKNTAIDFDMLEEKVKDYILNKNIESFETVYKTYYPFMEKWGIKNNNSEYVGDLMDVVLIRTIKKWDMNGSASFKTYFFKCCKIWIMREWKFQNVEKRKSNVNNEYLNKKIQNKDGTGTEIGSLISCSNSKNEINNFEFRFSIEALEKRLNKTEFSIMMKILEGKTNKMIAQELNISSPAVNESLKRLRKKEVSSEIKTILQQSMLDRITI